MAILPGYIAKCVLCVAELLVYHFDNKQQRFSDLSMHEH